MWQPLSVGCFNLKTFSVILLFMELVHYSGTKPLNFTVNEGETKIMKHSAWAYLFAIIISLIIGDALFSGGQNFLFLMRKGNEFVEWLAFWR